MADWKKVVLAKGTSTQYIKGDGTFATFTDSLPLTGGTVTGNVTMQSSSADSPILTLKNTHDGSGSPRLYFEHDSNTPADNDEIGQIRFYADNDAGVSHIYGWLKVSATDVTATGNTEDGKMDFLTMKAGTETSTLVLESGNATFGGKLNFHRENGTGLTSYIEIRDSGTSSVRSGLGLGTADSTLVLYVDKNNAIGSGSALVLQTGGTDALTINGSQNVAIGSSGSGYRLDVRGTSGTFFSQTTATSGSMVRLRANNGSTSVLQINADGNIGIGTESPQALTHIGKFSGGSASAQEVLRLTGDYTSLYSGPQIVFTNQHDSGTTPNSGEYNLAGIYAFDSDQSWGGGLRFQTSAGTGAGGSALLDRMTILHSGNVGIGTTSPMANSDGIVGLEISSGTATGLTLKSTSSSQVYSLWADASGNLKIQDNTNNTTPLTINSSGNATFSGDVKLGVNKKIYAQSNSTNSIEFYNGATGAMNFVSGTASYDYPIEFRQNDAQVMTIKSQRVGIGTQSPAQGQSTPISDIKLDVAGNQMLSDLSTTNTDQSKLFFFRSDGAVGSQGQVPSGLKIGAIEWTALTDADDNNSISSARIEAETSNLWDSASNRNADLIFSTVGSNTLTEAMRIDSSQRVGIGSSSPSGVLEVNTGTGVMYITRGEGDDGSSAPAIAFLLDSNKSRMYSYGDLSFYTTTVGGTITQRMKLDSSGQLGIGTTSPNEKLEVAGNIRLSNGTNSAIYQDSTSEFLRIGAGGSGNDTPRIEIFGKDYGGANSGGDIIIIAGANGNVQDGDIRMGHDKGAFSEALTIKYSGNVGIGATSPDGTLHIHTATAGTVTADTWVDDLVVENSGDGGISILTPSANQGAIAFGDPDDANRAQITYQHSTDSMIFKSGGGTAVTINSSQQTTFNGNVNLGDDLALSLGGSTDAQLFVASSDGHTYFRNNTSSADIIFKVRVGSTETQVLRLDGNAGKVELGGDTHLTSGKSIVYSPTVYTSNVQGIKFDSASYTNDAIIQPVLLGSTGISLFIGSNCYVNTSGSLARYNTGEESSFIQVRPEGQLTFGTSDTSANPSVKMTIDSSGNVGIGTTNPRSKLHVAGGTASHGDDVYYYENVAFKDGSSSETGTLKITLPNLNSTTMAKFTIEGFDYTGDSRGQSWTVKVGGYMYNNNNWYNYYAHLEGRPPFSSVRLAQDGSKNLILLGTTSTTWAYPKVVITEVLAGFNNGEDWGSGYSMSWITSETGIANIHTPNIDYRMASNGDSIFSVVKTQDSSDQADYVKMYHDGTDGHLISNRGQLRLSSQSGIDAIKIDSSGSVSLKSNLSLASGSPVMYMSGSSGDHTRFGYAEGDPDVAYWRFYQDSGLTASITMDAITENTAGGRIEFNTGSSEVAIASVDSGGVFLGRNASGQNTTTELGGYGVLAPNGTRYGNYGYLVFNAPTNSYTAGARGWAITNGYEANKFALLQSTNANDEPVLTTAGEVGTNTFAPLFIDASGNTTINGALTVNENALTLSEDIVGNASYVRMNYDMPNSTDDAYGTVGMQRTSSTTYLGMLISSDSRDGIRFNTANGTPVERMRIDASGNVGINVDNPSKKLEVNGSYKLGSNAFINYNATYPYTINVENTAGVGNLTFQAGTGSTGFKSKIELQGGNTSTDASITMTTADTARMTILNSGNVGIGTASTSDYGAKLYIYEDDSSFANTGIHIENAKSDDAAILVLEGARTSTNDTGQVIFRNSDNNVALIKAFSGHGINNDSGELQFFVSEDGTGDVTTSAMTIDTNGRIGIGNSAPDKTLVVQGSGAEVVIADTGTFPTLRFREGGATKGAIRTSGGDMHFYSGNASTSDLAMTISSTGNVVVNDRIGIGTQSPSYPGLHISNSTPYIALQDSDGTNQKIEILHSGATTYFTGRNGGSYGSFVFRGYNGSVYSTAVTIDSSQRVGIQEVSPTEALHVKGNIKASGELIGKTYVTFVHNFTDDMGTTAHTIPWSTANEGTNNAKTDTNFVAPYPMSLVKIIIRPKAIQTAGTIRVVLKKEDDGDSTNDTVAQATPSGNLASNTAKVVTASDFDNTPDVGILDKINIELSTSVDVNTSATDWFVTTVWTMDVN